MTAIAPIDLSLRWQVVCGDALDVLCALPDGAVQTCVTSPPYFGLRDYGVDGQIGLEPTPAEYVARLIAVFREVKRVLRDDGTLWLNLGDSYNGYMANQRGTGLEVNRQAARKYIEPGSGLRTDTAKNKDLLGIPWSVSFALRADGWYLRSDIIWHKPNPMPESVTDRPTKAHEYLFLLSKNGTYTYDADAIREPDVGADHPRSVLDGQPSLEPTGGLMSAHSGLRTADGRNGSGRNKRSVWRITTEPYAGAHFAVMPTALVEPCVRAGCPQGGLVLDPFTGSGTVGVVALREGCRFVGSELNPEYVALARDRIGREAAQGTLALGDCR